MNGCSARWQGESVPIATPQQDIFPGIRSSRTRKRAGPNPETRGAIGLTETQHSVVRGSQHSTAHLKPTETGGLQSMSKYVVVMIIY